MRLHPQSGEHGAILMRWLIVGAAVTASVCDGILDARASGT